MHSSGHCIILYDYEFRLLAMAAFSLDPNTSKVNLIRVSHQDRMQNHPDIDNCFIIEKAGVCWIPGWPLSAPKMGWGLTPPPTSYSHHPYIIPESTWPCIARDFEHDINSLIFSALKQ